MNAMGSFVVAAAPLAPVFVAEELVEEATGIPIPTPKDLLKGGAKRCFKVCTRAPKTAKQAAKDHFDDVSKGLERKVIRSGRDGTGKIVGVGTGKGGPTYRPKGDGSYSVGKKPDIKHFRPEAGGGHSVNNR